MFNWKNCTMKEAEEHLAIASRQLVFQAEKYHREHGNMDVLEKISLAKKGAKKLKLIAKLKELEGFDDSNSE